jgi:UDP-arabinose 4-epimerase
VASAQKTIFVTGGAGYVGSHCCKAFAEAGWKVVVYDNLSRGWRDFVKWGSIVEGDILDLPRLTSAMQDATPDAVAHFAALAYVGESASDPGTYYRANTFGALNVLEAMRASGVENIVFSSTCATYGVPETDFIDEAHPQAPINPYGWSKLFVEKMLADFGNAYGMRSVCLRFFNAAGGAQNSGIGERHEPETHVIPLAIRGALRDDFVFTIHGDDYGTRDGTCVRDFIHVSDLADAYRRAIEYLSSGGASDVFNLGTGNGTKVKEIADAVERVTGRPLTRVVGPRRAGDPPQLVARAEKASNVLGWTPQRSGIDDILSDAFRWHSFDDRRLAKPGAATT